MRKAGCNNSSPERCMVLAGEKRAGEPDSLCKQHDLASQVLSCPGPADPMLASSCQQPLIWHSRSWSWHPVSVIGLPWEGRILDFLWYLAAFQKLTLQKTEVHYWRRNQGICSLSLSLSLTHTHTYTHTYMHACTHASIHARALT